MTIKYGTSRTVILIGRYAIKIPSFYSWEHFLFGLLGNMCETRFSKMEEPKMCPVLFSFPGGLFNIMPRCVPIDRESFFDLNVEEWRDCGTHIVPVENKLDSFGYLHGKIVAVDYGGAY